MLPLSGSASELRGFQGEFSSQVYRLRDATMHPEAQDLAIIRCSEDIDAAYASGFAGAVVIGEGVEILKGSNRFSDILKLSSPYGYLAEGDILGIRRNGRFRTLYRKRSSHNSFLVTERCNHYCLMCSQPPRNVDDGWILDEIGRAIPLVHPETASLGFTGGEPLLEWQRLVGVLTQCRDVLPHTSLHVLSNGRAFADSQVTAAWAAVAHPDLMVGIPIYSAIDHVHDYVVQATGALDETILGILKLKDKHQRVEVRVVLHAITAPRIAETCKWLARNLPFVDHVALMGLENTGFAIANDAALWIDPIDYQDQLAEGVEILSAARVNVSIYNLPLCVLKPSMWSYSVQSISDWKNSFVPECDSCSQRPKCSGFFATGRPRFSRGVHPIR